jgi:hypothetical protein
MKRPVLTLCILIELLGVITVSGGIGIELALKAEIGYILITVGSLVITSGGIIFAKFLRRC